MRRGRRRWQGKSGRKEEGLDGCLSSEERKTKKERKEVQEVSRSIKNKKYKNKKHEEARRSEKNEKKGSCNSQRTFEKRKNPSFPWMAVSCSSTLHLTSITLHIQILLLISIPILFQFQFHFKFKEAVVLCMLCLFELFLLEDDLTRCVSHFFTKPHHMAGLLIVTSCEVPPSHFHFQNHLQSHLELFSFTFLFFRHFPKWRFPNPAWQEDLPVPPALPRASNSKPM